MSKGHDKGHKGQMSDRDEPWDTTDMAYRLGGLSMEQSTECGEPVAYRVWDRMGGISFRRTQPSESEYVEWDALYTAPPKREWVGLNNVEIGRLTVFDGLHHVETLVLANFIRAIEAKLKEKNRC